MNDDEIFGTLTVTMRIERLNDRPHRATVYREHGITEQQARDRLRDLRGLNKELCGRHVAARFQPFQPAPVDLTTD